MAYSKTYSRINWENEPSTETPLNENNLNRMDNAVNVLDDRVVELSTHVDNLEEYEPRVSQLAEQARVSASNAATSETNAQAYANQALAHEQQAQIYRNQAEQFKDEAFSGTPEGYEDVVAKVNSLKEHTGTYLAEVGTHEGSALAKSIYGMSVQDGTPTPDSPVEIESAKADFRCTGKNLIPYPNQYERQYGKTSTRYGLTVTCNDDGSINVSGTCTSTNGVAIRLVSEDADGANLMGLKVGDRLVISGGLADRAMNIRFYNSVGGTIATYSAREEPNEITIPNGAVSFRIYPFIDYQQTVDITLRPMLTLADVDQTYELNQHTDITTDLTLRAIEVASTDGYTYERDGKYYIADTIDWSEDDGYVVTRRVKELNAKEKTWYLYNNFVYANINDAYKLNVIISNRFPYGSPLSNNTFNMVYTTTVGIWHLDVYSDDTDSVENWTDYINTNDVIFVYALKTPIKEAITSEQAQALLSLKTYDEATSISATGDIEPSVDLEYSKDRNTALALTGHNLAHKNALKLNDINTALIELGGN